MLRLQHVWKIYASDPKLVLRNFALIAPALQVSEHVWVQRIWVKGFVKGAEDTFSFRMQQRLGGRYDGIWFTDSLTCDKCPREVLLSV